MLKLSAPLSLARHYGLFGFGSFSTLGHVGSNFAASRAPISGSHLYRYSRALHMEHGTYLIPHPVKAKTGGEDAALAQNNILIVADGISAWGLSGLSAGAYSREMVQRIEEEYRNQNGNGIMLHPKAAVKRAYMKMRGIGTTTICVVAYDEANNELLAANIGDSGFIVYRPAAPESSDSSSGTEMLRTMRNVRDEPRQPVCRLFEDEESGWKVVHVIKGGEKLPNGVEPISVAMGVSSSAGEIVFRSPRQIRAANAPRQLGTGSIDSPAHADSISIRPLIPGDWVIAATDGVWDNLYEEQITSLLDGSDGAVEAAQNVATYASKKALDRSWESPFALRWRFMTPPVGPVMGGHLDDIAVVVGHLSE